MRESNPRPLNLQLAVTTTELLSISICFESSGSGSRPRPWLLTHLWPLIQGAKFKKWSRSLFEFGALTGTGRFEANGNRQYRLRDWLHVLYWHIWQISMDMNWEWLHSLRSLRQSRCLVLWACWASFLQRCVWGGGGGNRLAKYRRGEQQASCGD